LCQVDSIEDHGEKRRMNIRQRFFDSPCARAVVARAAIESARSIVLGIFEVVELRLADGRAIQAVLRGKLGEGDSAHSGA